MSSGGAIVSQAALNVSSQQDVPEDPPWNLVAARGHKGQGNQQKDQSGGQGRRQRPVQQGTAQIQVPGSEAAPYDVVISNTNPASTEDIIKDVLIHVSKNMSEDLKLKDPLEIREVECLTKPREDGSRIWMKTWRVQVPAKFKAHMLRAEAYPAGWTSRRYFPPKAPRQAVPGLYPGGSEPPEKRPNLDIQVQQ